MHMLHDYATPSRAATAVILSEAAEGRVVEGRL
jgi:hypothetical protein